MPAVNASVLLHLLTTVKTHKAQGKVEHRNVHAGTRWAFTGLAQWVTAQLMENLRCDHFLTGLQDFVFSKVIKNPSSTGIHHVSIGHETRPL